MVEELIAEHAMKRDGAQAREREIPKLDEGSRLGKRGFASRALVAFCLFLVLAIVKTYPLVVRLGTHIGDLTDPLHLTWILAWDVHALASDDLVHLFDANTFYPAERSLAFSEHMLGVVPIFAAGYLATGNPIVGYNLLLLLSFALSGLSMFCLVQYWTKQFWPSLTAGALFGFAAFRFGMYNHLHILNVFWAPLALLFLDRFLCLQGWRDLFRFAAFYCLQVLSSIYLGYMLTVGVTLYVSYYVLVVDRSLVRLSMLPKVLAFVGLSAGVLLPFHVAYFKAQQSWDIVRDIHEVMFYAPDVRAYLTAPPLMSDMYLGVFRPVGGAERWLFPGLVLPLLAILGSMGRIDTVPGTARRLRQALWLVLVAAVLLSLGPFLVLAGVRTRIPLPYLILYHIVPGFTAIRVPGRFVVLAVLAASPLAAMGVIRCSAAVSRFLRSRSRLVPAVTALGFIGLFMFELGLKPLPLVEVPRGKELRRLQRWLKTERPGPIVELPFGYENDFQYMYSSTEHWLPLVNGVSSFFPPTYEEIQSALQELPGRKAVEYAGALGIKAVVVHRDRLSWDKLKRWAADATDTSGLREMAAFGPISVYSVPGVAVSPSLTVESPGPQWVSAARRVRLGFLAHPGVSRPWRHPGPQGWLHGSTQWTDRGTGRSVITAARFLFPPVIPAGTTVRIPVETDVPKIAGAYTLKGAIPALHATTDARRIEVRTTVMPTSADSPRRLAARYSGFSAAAPIVTGDFEPIRLEIIATNAGSALWLARARDDRGAVRLGWRWFQEKRELAQLAGRSVISYDVFPGDSYRFKVVISPPAVPGVYTLELGLVSELIAWFTSEGTPAIVSTVEVRPINRDRGGKAPEQSAR